MIQSRRLVLDTLREGPTLFAGLPGEEVDLDALAAHLVARGIDGGIHVTDGSLEGLLWIQQGEPGETWFFEAAGQEAVLPMTSSRDLLLDIAARGGAISVFVGTQPDALTARFASATGEPASSLFVAGPMAAVDTTVSAISVEPRMPVDGAGPPAVAMPAPGMQAAVRPEVSGAAAGPQPGWMPPAQRWPAILAEVRARIARHRGPKLAAQFTAALTEALREHGGSADGGHIVAPPLSEAAWRDVAEAACAPVAAVAGRAFVDRTIAAAEHAAGDLSHRRGDHP